MPANLLEDLLNELDKDIEGELAEAMAGFEFEIKEETEAAKRQAIESANAPKVAGSRKTNEKEGT